MHGIVAAALQAAGASQDMIRLQTRDASLILAMVLAVSAAPSVPLGAQDTVRTAAPTTTAARSLARLRVVFRPPATGVRRERSLSRGDDGARALVPDIRIDSMIPQTLRDAPYVAVCAAGQPDSAWLKVRVGERVNDVMIALRPGLNRISLGVTQVLLADGDVAEWTLATRSGQVFLQEYIQRHVVRSTPTVNALATNGIWYDALDRFVADAIGGIPLAGERLDAFVSGVGAAPCAAARAPD
jgi:hypothetical protein